MIIFFVLMIRLEKEGKILMLDLIKHILKKEINGKYISWKIRII
jgi:hypothetical protein